MKTFEQWLESEGLDFPLNHPTMIRAMKRGWNAAMAERQKPLNDDDMLDWNEQALQIAEQQRTEQAPVKDSLTTERPEDGPVAWGVEFKGKPYRNVRPSYERDSIAKLTEGNDGVRVAPFYAESVKAERDALRVDLDRSKARTDRAINEIRALREKVGQLEYSNAVNGDAKAQAAKHAEEADRLRERVKELEADAKRYRWLRDGNDTKGSEAFRIATRCYGLEWDEAIDAAMRSEV